jgi:hypothetical protein
VPTPRVRGALPSSHHSATSLSRFVPVRAQTAHSAQENVALFSYWLLLSRYPGKLSLYEAITTQRPRCYTRSQ